MTCDKNFEDGSFLLFFFSRVESSDYFVSSIFFKNFFVCVHACVFLTVRFGTKSLLVGRYMTAICKLISDANYQVWLISVL